MKKIEFPKMVFKIGSEENCVVRSKEEFEKLDSSWCEQPNFVPEKKLKSKKQTKETDLI